VAIRRVRNDVTLLREKGDVAIQRVRKRCHFTEGKGDVAILRVRNDVTLLSKWGHCYNEGT